MPWTHSIIAVILTIAGVVGVGYGVTNHDTGAIVIGAFLIVIGLGQADKGRPKAVFLPPRAPEHKEGER